ncbi:hypothetical protein AB0D09_42490 [Streptomyces sp. NPDC049097]|uniref:hypothetical protein n=1 Tax=unclassified Streptomyces TaxID=2593676 RepID=UPI0033CA189F
MSREQRINPRFAEDLPFNEVSGPPRYNRTTSGPVQYVSIANVAGVAIGYIWANDEDEAAGWLPPPGLRPDDINAGALWLWTLRDAKARDLAPTALLAELLQGDGDEERSHVVADSLSEMASLDALRELVTKS